MRSNIDPETIEQLMTILGREVHGSGRIYFTGGTSQVGCVTNAPLLTFMPPWKKKFGTIQLRLAQYPYFYLAV